MATSGMESTYFCNSLPNNDLREWSPLSLTLVEYPKGDLFGKILAFISLAPFGIGSGFITLILFRRDLHTITFFLGTLASEMVNYFLKHTIQDPRPITRPNDYNEFGMPSSHSQFMWFFTTYIIFFVFIRLHHMNNNTIMESMSKLMIIGSAVALALTVCFSRVYLQYHTVAQVICGAVVGLLFATVWFALTYFVLTPVFPSIVSW